MLDEVREYGISSLLSALRSYEFTVDEHVAKLADPAGQDLDKPWDAMDTREREGLLRQWCRDLVRNREQADIVLRILQERGVSP